MSPLLVGAGLGLLAACGLLVAIFSAPPMRPIRLADRLSPYLRDNPPPSRLLFGETGRTAGALAPVRRLLGPVLADLIRWIDRILGGRGSIRRRLAILGNSQTVPAGSVTQAPLRTVEDFRIEQVLWGAVGLGAGVGLTALYSIGSGRINVLSALLFCLGGVIGGVLGRDWWLTNEVSRHEQAIIAEFPVVAELLALAVTAGEGPTGAIDRVCRLTGGALAVELGDALARARAGAPLVQALQEVADRTNIESLARFIDGLIVAIERGTPLADVLRAQAADVREAGKRKLLELGGKKEIGMMVPVVFLVLPVTVLFALYPGLISISQLAH
jgi:tight adherence protein C